MNASKLYYIIKHYILDYDNDNLEGYKATYQDLKNGYSRTYRTNNERTIDSDDIIELAKTKTKKEIDDFFKEYDKNY